MTILDEIDSGLDIDAMRDVAKAVNALKRPDSSVLMVTHYKVGCCQCVSDLTNSVLFLLNYKADELLRKSLIHVNTAARGCASCAHE